MERKQILTLMSLIFVTLILSACGGSDSAESKSSSANEPAMVDMVTIDFRENHYYAVVTGFYPDSCTRISEVRQEFNGSAFNLSLSTSHSPTYVATLSPSHTYVIVASEI